MSVINYAKEHPVSTGVIVVVGGLIFYLIAFGGSSEPNVVVAGPRGPSDAEVMANANIAAAQISAGAANAQAAAAVQAAQIGANVSLNSDNKAAEIAMRNIESMEAIEGGRIAATLAAALEEMKTGVSVAAFDYNATLASIEADKEIAVLNKAGLIEAATLEAAIRTNADNKAAEMTLANFDLTRDLSNANVEMTRSVLDSQTDQAVIYANLQQNTVNANAAVNMNSINAQRDVAVAQIGAEERAHTLTITNQSAVAIAGLNADKEIEAMAIQAANQQDANFYAALPLVKKKNRDDVIQAHETGQIYYPNSGPSKTAQVISSIGGAASGIVGAIGSVGGLFSDPSLKENIINTGFDNTGAAVYEFNYKGSTNRYSGNMANEIARNNRGNTSEKLSRSKGGFLKVKKADAVKTAKSKTRWYDGVKILGTSPYENLPQYSGPLSNLGI